MEVTEISPIATFSVCRGVRAYIQLNPAVRYYSGGTKTFHTAPATAEVDALIQEWNTPKHVKLFFRPNVWSVNMEAKLDAMAKQLANLTLVLKKSHFKCPEDLASTGSSGNKGYERCC